jgi:hypothetical protein
MAQPFSVSWKDGLGAGHKKTSKDLVLSAFFSIFAAIK